MVRFELGFVLPQRIAHATMPMRGRHPPEALNRRMTTMQRTLVMLTTEDKARVGVGSNTEAALADFITKNSPWLRTQDYIDGEADDNGGTEVTFERNLDLLGWKLIVTAVDGKAPIAEVEEADELDLRVSKGDIIGPTGEVVGYA